VVGRRGRREQILDDLEEKTGFWKFKQEALDCTLSRTGFGKCNGPVVRQDYKMKERFSE
jgi:hypothetical protein